MALVDVRPPSRPAIKVGYLAAGIILIVGVLGGYLVLHNTGWLGLIADAGLLKKKIVDFGHLGPVAVVALMTMAIVLTPIPSAPIALAAGAVYGHTWGTLYIVLGAEAGALLAFAVARLVGFQVLQKWLGDRLSIPLFRSQWTMTAIVFGSRLLPFVSFDIVSYAAGLTPLAPWRFAIATFAGIVPASFLLAHFGGEMASGDPQRLAVTGLVLGLLVLLPLLWKVLIRRRQPSAAQPVKDDAR